MEKEKENEKKKKIQMSLSIIIYLTFKIIWNHNSCVLTSYNHGRVLKMYELIYHLGCNCCKHFNIYSTVTKVNSGLMNCHAWASCLPEDMLFLGNKINIIQFLHF